MDDNDYYPGTPNWALQVSHSFTSLFSLIFPLISRVDHWHVVRGECRYIYYSISFQRKLHYVKHRRGIRPSKANQGDMGKEKEIELNLVYTHSIHCTFLYLLHPHNSLHLSLPPTNPCTYSFIVFYSWDAQPLPEDIISIPQTHPSPPVFSFLSAHLFFSHIFHSFHSLVKLSHHITFVLVTHYFLDSIQIHLSPINSQFHFFLL